MKIDGYHVIKNLETRLSNINEPRNPSIINKEGLSKTNGNHNDDVELSPGAMEFSRIKGAIKELSSMREEKVAELSTEVRQGMYKINPEEIASSLLKEHMMDALLTASN